MDDAKALIGKLDLAPHPEGGWYKETWRPPDLTGGRAIATAILFLLEHGQRSHWHRVDASEIWLWHAGSPLTLSTARGSEGPVQTQLLGGNPLVGESPQHIVAAGDWQATEAHAGWGLVSCIVAPGFQFEGFTLAPPGWSPGVESQVKR
ncbi:MAG TPA: cupin domain-containing protein [Sphingobium sp.]